MLRYLRLSLLMAFAAGLLAAAAVTAAPPASAQGRGADYSEFYEALEPFGRWFQHPRWGLVWWPVVQQHEDDWRPYTRGQWVFTDDHGWYWDADEEWGWAVYHYGRWVLDERYGWLWVPGNEWGPAWVAWRESDEHVGWAPLPPEAYWEPAYGVRYSYAEYDSPYWAPIWCFVEPRYLIAPRVWHHFWPRSRNVYLIGRTRYSTRYALVGSRVYNRGIDVHHLARLTRRPVPSHKVRAFASVREARSLKGQRDFVGVYRPRLSGDGQRARFSPRLAAPDSIEQARRSRAAALRDGDRDRDVGRSRDARIAPYFKDGDRDRDARRDGDRRTAPSFKDGGPGPRDLRSVAPPDRDRVIRERSATPPPIASIPSPRSSQSDGPPPSFRRLPDRPPTFSVPPQPDDNRRFIRREPRGDGPPVTSIAPRQELQTRDRPRDSDRSRNSGPPPGFSSRSLQPRSAPPPQAIQRLPQPEPRATASIRQAPAVSSRESERSRDDGDRRRKRDRDRNERGGDG